MKHKSTALSALAILAGAILAGVMLGGCPKPSDNPEPGPAGVVYRTSAEILPEALPYSDGTLIYGGTPLDVKVSQQKGENNETILAINQEGLEEPLETERYIANETGFRYAGGKEESFDPAIPLINEYPFDSSSTWTWNGEMIYAGQTFPARADITAEAAKLNLSSGSFNTIFVTVELHIEGSNPEQPKTFKFWIAPGEGVIRREFTASSTREPSAQPK